MADILELVRKDIQGKRGRLMVVARESGVPKSTLHEIVYYGKSDPRKKTVDKLLRYYRRTA